LISSYCRLSQFFMGWIFKTFNPSIAFSHSCFLFRFSDLIFFQRFFAAPGYVAVAFG